MNPRAVNEWLTTELHLEKEVAFGKRKADFASRDRKMVFEVRLGGRGGRELRDGILLIAQLVAGAPTTRRGYLMIAIQRSTVQRVREEWVDALAALRGDVRDRLQLVGVVEGKIVVEPGGAEAEAMA